MSKVQVINFCRSWMRLIDALKDLEHQREFWFDPKKSVISSYEETLDLFLGDYERAKENGKFQNLDETCRNLLEKLYQKVNGHEMNTERYVNYSFEEALLGDPKWLEIVDLAQQSYQALENYANEVENDKR